MDLVFLAVITSLIAGAFLITSAVIIASQNAGARNLPLAVAALLGVIVGFFIQLHFELTKSTKNEIIGTELTIDRVAPFIRQWQYDKGGWRPPVEGGASDWVVNNHKESFDRDRQKLTSDLVMFSLLSLFTHQEFDWQLERQKYAGKVSGGMESLQGVSKPDQCGTYIESDLRQRLTSAGNLFANSPLQLLGGRLCLPPKTDLDISTDTLTIRNPLCQVSFKITNSGGTFFVDPNTRQFAQLPNAEAGEPRFETRAIAIKVETTFFALRAQHRDHKKYKDWATRVVDRARAWFEN